MVHIDRDPRNYLQNCQVLQWRYGCNFGLPEGIHRYPVIIIDDQNQLMIRFPLWATEHFALEKRYRYSQV